VPARQAGGQRRYSTEDVRLLRRIQSLSRDGVSLEGIRRIVELEAEGDQLRDTVGELVDQISVMRSHVTVSRTFTAGSGGVTTNTHAPSARDKTTDVGTSRQHCEPRRRRRLDRTRLEQAVLFALAPSSPRYALSRPRFALSG